MNFKIPCVKRKILTVYFSHFHAYKKKVKKSTKVSKLKKSLYSQICPEIQNLMFIKLLNFFFKKN